MREESGLQTRVVLSLVVSRRVDHVICESRCFKNMPARTGMFSRTICNSDEAGRHLDTWPPAPADAERVPLGILPMAL